MKILFLEIETERSWAVAAIGPACIAAYVRRHGHEAGLLRVGPDQSLDSIVAAIACAAPDLLGVSLTTRQWLRARAVVAGIRHTLAIPVIAGGLHASFCPETVLAAPGFDYVCIGEGEAATQELLDALAQGRTIGDGAIRNVWVKGGPRPELRPLWSNLDELPFMARDLLDEKYGVVHMNTRRGCPFPCAYCAARQLRQLYRGQPAVQQRSVPSVVQELQVIRSHGPLNYIIFLDDLFTLPTEWVMAFCAAYGQELRIGFSLHARVDTVDRPMLQALAAAGCKHIVYGVESGSERIRQNVMQRFIPNEQMIAVFRQTKELGMLATANYMLGLPEETADDIEQTLALHEQLQPNDFGYFVFYPYPGTELFRLCLERGYLPPNYLELPAHHATTILNMPQLRPEAIARYYDRFTAVRQRDYERQYGRHFSTTQIGDIKQNMQQSADLG